MTQQLYRIFLSAAEASGDKHCAGLMNAIRAKNPDISFVGVGGPQMAEAGCEMLEITTDKAAMLTNVWRHLLYFNRLRKQIAHFLKAEPIDLVVVCDSPAFNFHIAKAARLANIPTLFYVAPQLWAWAAWRIKKMHKFCSRLACILPFEQDWFARHGVDVEFVGNPMLDGLKITLKDNCKSYENFDPDSATIVLMPGSRQHEIDTLFRPMQQICNQLRRKYKHLQVVTVAVDEKSKEMLRARHILNFRCDYLIGTVPEAARQADLALVASGSATLQVAAMGCPMIVMYQCNAILYELVGRWLIKTPQLSLVNILAGEERVREFMPYFRSTEPIVRTADQLLANPQQLAELSESLVRLVKPLAKGTAAEKTAKIAIDMLKNPPSPPPAQPAASSSC